MLIGRLKEMWFVCLTAAVLWTVLAFLLMSNLPVTLQFSKGQQGCISAMTVGADGTSLDVVKVCTPSTEGLASFKISADASSFGFRFSERESGYAFRALRVLGIKLLDGAQAARFNMREKIFDDYPVKAGDPLLLHPKDNAIFELTNVFPYLLKVWRAMRWLVAFLPISFMMFFLVYRFFGRQLADFIGSVLDMPIIFYLILGAVILLALPSPINPVLPGLDQSWEWMFNHYAFSGAIGRDFVFTYGPLGFLIKPQGELMNAYVGVLVNIGFSLVFALEVVSLYRAGRGTVARGTAVMLIVLWLIQWPNGMEWKWCAVSVIACAMAVFMSELGALARNALFVVAAITAVLQSFIKFSSCISVMGEQMFLVGIYVIIARCKALRSVITYISVVLCCIVLGVSVLFPNMAAFGAWVKGSLEISSGYNLYMGGDRSWVDVTAPFLLIAVIGGHLFVGKGRRSGLLFWLSFAPLIFCTLKYAVVRQGALPLALMAAVVAALGAIFIPNRSRSSWGLACICVFIGLGTDAIFRNSPPRLGVSMRNLIDSVSCRNAFARTQNESRERHTAASLPSAWIQQIGTNKVMIVGWEMGPAMSGDLNLVPYPATQTYSAYTPYLDKLCARRVTETDINFVLVPADPWTFDSRNIYFDNPRLWHAVRQNFSFVDGNDVHVLLRRRAIPIYIDDLSYMFRFKRTVVGRVLSLFLRTPQTLANVTFSDGSCYCCAANPEVLDSMPLMNTLPTVPSEVPLFFNDNVAGMRKIESIGFSASRFLNVHCLERNH